MQLLKTGNSLLSVRVLPSSSGPASFPNADPCWISVLGIPQPTLGGCLDFACIAPRNPHDVGRRAGLSKGLGHDQFSAMTPWDAGGVEAVHWVWQLFDLSVVKGSRDYEF